ncbi:MAG: transposase, partial [Proteobacteria bacterium]|nr:transposase [Pseudomonadota bacterium]
MRRALQPQLSFTAPLTHNDRLAELQQIDKILDENPHLVELVYADLVRDIDPKKGRTGLAAETVLRILILKQTYDFTYEDLEFYLGDSPTLRWFCRLDCTELPKKSPMQRDIKKLQPETLKAAACAVVRYAMEQGIENGRKVRSDCTAVETMIHQPTDSSLLADCVRVLTRLLIAANKSTAQVAFSNHTRRANRRAKAIEYARGRGRRKRLYRDLLKITGKTVGYAERAIP